MQVKTNIDFTHTSAIFSDCRLFRYVLERHWDGGNGKLLIFLMLNPSVADHELEDNTVRRCCLYAKDWGFSGLIVLNIFAYRATDPKDMKAYHAPIGKDNDRYILETVKREDIGLIVGGWGIDGKHLGRGEYVKNLIKEYKLHYLALTKNNQPNHPLYLKKDLIPIPF